MNDASADRLAIAISQLAHEIRELRRERTDNNNQAILLRLAQMESKIMSAISEFLAKQKAFNDRQGAGIDSLVTSITGLTGDVKTLNDKITELQNSQGGVTPEDQILIDELETTGEAISTRLEAAAAALGTLDSQTPPALPTV